MNVNMELETLLAFKPVQRMTQGELRRVVAYLRDRCRSGSKRAADWSRYRTAVTFYAGNVREA